MRLIKPKINWTLMQCMNYLSERQNDSDVERFTDFLSDIHSVGFSNDGYIRVSNEDDAKFARHTLINAVEKHDMATTARAAAGLYLHYAKKSFSKVEKALIKLRQSKGCDYGNSFRVMGEEELWAVIDGKMCRLANLTRSKKKKPKHEPIVDTYMDTLVYMGLIDICRNAYLYRETYHKNLGTIKYWLWHNRMKNLVMVGKV